MKFIYTGIRVRDLDRSLDFYTRMMGMEIIQRSKITSSKGEIVVLQSPGSEQVLELNFYESDSRFNTPYEVGEGLDHLGFGVKDLRKTLDDFRRMGIIPVEEIDEGGQGKYAYVKDPNGIWIEIFQMK
ncbi:MAG: VOC family protein [Theionarchaea archaeon]|nr:VOC family protein [Theionarchaea archaeon]